MTDTGGDRQWTRWRDTWADRIKRTDGTVAPPAGLPEVEPAPDHHVWDSWPLRDRSGEIATIDGWQVLISLTAPATVTPGDRHDIAEHRYFISRDGREWLDRGPSSATALSAHGSGRGQHCTTTATSTAFILPRATPTSRN